MLSRKMLEAPQKCTKAFKSLEEDGFKHNQHFLSVQQMHRPCVEQFAEDVSNGCTCEAASLISETWQLTQENFKVTQ